MAPTHKVPSRRGSGLPPRRAKFAARVLYEAEGGKSDVALSAEYKVGNRTIARWRARELAGKLPGVTAELNRLRAQTADVVKLRAEQVLEAVYDFLARATKGDPKDPRMVEAMVKAGEFLFDTVTMAGMMPSGVSRTRPSTQDRTADRPVPGVAGGARDREQPASGGGTGSVH